MRMPLALATLAISLVMINANSQQQNPVDQSTSNNPPSMPLNGQWSSGAIPYGAANMAIDIFPAVTGKPFNTQVNARKIETKPDGKQITYESHGVLARDSNGRVLQEGLPS